MITRDQIQSAVEISAPSVIKEIYDIAMRQIQMEAARQTTIDGKATSLLATIGIAISVAMAILSASIPSLRGEDAATVAFFVLAGMIVVFALFSALMACRYAYMAIRITDEFRTIDEESVFNKDALSCAASQDSEERQATAYRQFLLPQLGEIMQNDFAVNDKKATLVLHGQQWYIAMVISLLLVGVLLIFGRLIR